jgi:hypothetical protein
VTSYDSKVARIERLAGDRIAEGTSDDWSIEELRSYADNPLGFMREVLQFDPWSKQEEIALAVRDHPLVNVRGANNLGKDALAGALALWWAYAREGLVLLTSASERQVREILMRKEIGQAFRRARLPGELLTTGLRVDDETRMLAFTSDDSSRHTGYHQPRVLVLISEAQGVDDDAWEGLLTCASGDDCCVFAYGNPVAPTGRFYMTSRPHTQWHKIQVSAFDLIETGRKLPGAVTRAGIDRLAAEYGTDSPIYIARVLGEFPETAVNALVSRFWLDRAAALHESRAFENEAMEKPIDCGLDLGRSAEGDPSCLAVTQGNIVRGFHIWRERDSTVLRAKVEAQLRNIGVFPWQERDAVEYSRVVDQGLPPSTGAYVAIDAHGLGGPIFDEMRAAGWPVQDFSSSRKARDTDRFVNARAEAYWNLRVKLERGLIALPRDAMLFEELQATTWCMNAKQQIQILAKDDIRKSLPNNRSPDRADALAMAFARPGFRMYTGPTIEVSW